MRKLLFFALLVSMAVSLTAQPARSFKRGASENAFGYPAEIHSLSPGVSWTYNWGPNPTSYVRDVLGGGDAEMEFVPMAWNGNFNESALRSFYTEHPDAKYLLGFNEPNFRAQANMTPQQAAALWPRLEAIADEFGLKLVAPALNYPDGAINDGNTYQPEQWMDAFLAAYPQARIDYLALHCYMNSPAAQIGFVENFAKKYGKQVWLTEFCAWEGTVDSITQMNTMVQKIQDLELSPYVHRYAWFKARGSNAAPYYRLVITPNMVTHLPPAGTLTWMGQIYTHMSPFDTTYYYRPAELIPATNYVYSKVVQLRPNTDGQSDVKLNISSFGIGSVGEYLVEVPQAGEYKLTLRHSSMNFISTPRLELKCDGVLVTNLDLPYTGMTSTQDKWQTFEATVTLPAGKHRLTFTGKYSSTCKLAWLLLESQGGFQEGDVNGDGEVSIADVTMLVDLVVRQASNERSDVNNDSETSVADVTKLVEILLNQ